MTGCSRIRDSFVEREFDLLGLMESAKPLSMLEFCQSWFSFYEFIHIIFKMKAPEKLQRCVLSPLKRKVP